MISATDFKYAARTLRKSPLFTITSVVTIALGIGASTAIFSVTDAVLLRPLPYKDPDRLVLACSDMKKRDVRDFPFANADFFDLRNGTTRSFEDLAAVRTGRILMPRDDGTPEQIRVANVTTNFLRMLGARIIIGRDFEDSDGQPQPPPPAAPAGGAQAAAPPRLPVIAILSYEYWQRRYGGNTAVVGHPMLGSKGGPLVAGVLAPGFELLFPPSRNQERLPDVWYAMRLNYDGSAQQRNGVSLYVVGRLRQGVSIDRAQAEARLVSAQIDRGFPIKQTSGFDVRLEPMHQHLVSEVRPAILALMGAVIFLLLIACANVANLMLVRASLRERDLAVRTALGGPRWRLVGQMLAETLLIAGLGALLGVGLAWAGIQELLAIGPANLPRLDSITVDPRVLAFTAIAALTAAAIFGMAPALRASRPDVMQVLRASGRTSALGGARLLRNSVVVAEVALSFVLLVGSGLMVRTFIALQRIDPGFDPHNMLTFLQFGGRGGNTPQARAAFVREMERRLRAVPGVEAVTSSFPFPLAGGFSPIRWGKEDALSDASKFQAADFQIVLPGYFEAMRTPLIAGRTFTEDDNAPTRNVAVVDELFAAKAFPKESAVGKRVLIRIRTPEAEWVQVIGVVAHTRQSSLADPGREQIYFADGFLGYGFVGFWGVRTAGNPANYADRIRAEIKKFDPQTLLTQVQPLEELVVKAEANTRFSLLLIALFAGIAALLAGVGLYGVLSTVVRQRTAEIGVRMALGAAPGTIFNLVVGHGLRLSATGIVVGLIAALGLTRVMTSMLVGVKATDPLTYVAMAVVFFMVAAAGSWFPARRAAGLDPTEALREE